AFAEIHVRDLSNNYDFLSIRVGMQPFVSDFRGFIFNDTNLGIRIFGNYDNNRWHYNLAAFDMREKDTYSDLNEFDPRKQQVYVANVFRQDLIWKGYTGELTFVGAFADDSRPYDKTAELELSVDKDWMRHKLSIFYASGDSDPADSHATGFDTVFDRPFFIGGPFSFFSHQGFNLAGTAVNFKQRDSLVIDFRTSK